MFIITWLSIYRTAHIVFLPFLSLQGNWQKDKYTNVTIKPTWRCGRQVMSLATPRLVTAVRSKQSSCSSCRPRREGSAASVTWVLLSDSFFNLHKAHTVLCQHPGCNTLEQLQIIVQHNKTAERPGHGGELADSLICDLCVVCQVQLWEQRQSGEEWQPAVCHRVASRECQLVQL